MTLNVLHNILIPYALMPSYYSNKDLIMIKYKNIVIKIKYKNMVNEIKFYLWNIIFERC